MLMAQPILSHLHLPAILERLAEQTMGVADAIAICRDAKARQAVKEASRETTQTAIAKRSIRFIAHHIRKIYAIASQCLFGLILKAQIVDRVLKDPAQQEFHRQVVNPLAILGVGLMRGVEPRRDQLVAHGA